MEIKTKLMAAIKEAATTMNNQYVEAPMNTGLPGWLYSLPTSSGVMITPDSVLQLSIAAACIRIIGQDVSKLPIVVERKDSKGEWVQDDDPATLKFWLQPNEQDMMSDVLLRMIYDYYQFGNAYAVIIRNRDGSPKKLIPLNARSVTILTNPKGVISYQASDARLIGEKTSNSKESGAVRKITQEDMIHHRDVQLYGDGRGISMIDYCANIFGLGTGLQETTSRRLNNGGNLDGFWKSTSKVSAEKSSEIQKLLEKAISGVSNSGRVFFANDLEFVPISMTPVNLQLLEATQKNDQDIARLFRVPLYKLGLNQTDKVANREQDNQEYISSVLKSHTFPLETNFLMKCMFEKDIGKARVRFDFTDMVMPDMSTRVDIAAKAKMAGLATTQFLAAQLGWPVPTPAQGGDLYTIPTNTAVVDGAGGESGPQSDVGVSAPAAEDIEQPKAEDIKAPAPKEAAVAPVKKPRRSRKKAD